MSNSRSNQSLRDDSIAIWKAGVDAVAADRLVREVVTCDDEALTIAGERIPLEGLGQIIVVGAGKAGAGMTAGVEQALSDTSLADRVTGWINVPADCVRPTQSIHLHAARPAGVNEPTAEGVAGSERILQLVAAASPQDVSVVLLSGGGSALLPAPVEGVSLSDKQTVTRGLMRAGARIDELNCVRKHLSRIKGGRLAQACRAGKIIALIISDVIGDPLDVIASGPTIADSTTAADAIAVLLKFADRMPVIPESAMTYLRGAAKRESSIDTVSTPQVKNVIIGNIDVAMRAAADEARRRGYTVQSLGGANAGIARAVGRDLAERCLDAQETHAGPLCLLSGGEPVVQLVDTDEPRQGGRNQELVLAAAERLWDDDLSGIAILSGGTDGEDGPTDAAGAVVDAELVRLARERGLNPGDFLATNNSYPFFDQSGGLLKTGPTHTNVMDLRVALCE
ncbi:MAG: DUF4147 domain-containing protein [Planctomycetaceae bacterium]|nr:DUF4147 domain-containing protein [Planctomycetaceae bacterium]